MARAGEGGAPFVVALFTAASAVCVTGLSVVDTATYWSGFGEAVILLSVQLGGYGIVTVASLLALFVSRRLGLRTRLAAASETGALGLGDVRRVLLGVAVFSIGFELIAAVVLAARLFAAYDEPLADALYQGVFHAVMAYNHAGFALFSDSLTRFVDDPVIPLVVTGLVVVGSLGFPVLFELHREWRSGRRWSLHTRIVLWGTAVLLVAGTAGIVALEWGNEKTFGGLSVGGKLIAGLFASAQTRSAGFNAVDIGAMDPATLLLQDVLMFIGGGPASTAGGVKITTVALLLFAVLAEGRGDPTVTVWRRRIPEAALRQAVSVTLISASAVVLATGVLLRISDAPLDAVVFEVISAAATVGLSTGITADLPEAGQVLLAVLMFLGRIGPITLAAALALRQRPVLYRLPEERPIVG